MPDFIADTDGIVLGVAWDDLANFTRGYVEAMLFTETSAIAMVNWADEESQERVREGTADGSIPADAGWGDIHPDAFEAIQSDCMAFESDTNALYAAAGLGYPVHSEAAGRDFWYTRNRHGAGFWDRKELPAGLGAQLTEIAHGFGEVYVDFAPDEGSPTGYGYVVLS